MSCLFFVVVCLKICGSASAPDNASVQGVRAGSKLCGFSRTGARRARRARTTRCSRYRGHAPTDLKQKRDCSHSTSQRTADAFPVVASLPLKNSNFSEGEKRRPEIRLLFAGYHSTVLLTIQTKPLWPNTFKWCQYFPRRILGCSWEWRS